MKTWLAKIESGKPKFSEYTSGDFRDWCKENEGKQLRVEPVKKQISENLRGYYFGAVIPVIRSTCGEWEKLDADQIHQIMKKQFFYFEAFNTVTERTERFGRSVMSEDEWNNSVKAMGFLEVISNYLADCGQQMPDSEQYKNMRDMEVARRSDYQSKVAYPEFTGEPTI